MRLLRPIAIVLLLMVLLGGVVGPGPGSAAAQSARRPTGKVTVALTSLREETFLPWTGPLARKSYAGPLVDFLVHAKSDSGELLPGLARSWTVSADRKTVTFKLREGVKWHDGSDFTSADVKFTLERYIDKDSVGFSAGFFRTALDGVDTPDGTTVVLRLKSPQPALLAELSSYGAVWMASRKHVLAVGDKAADQKPMGTGPYRFVRLAPAQEVEYEALDQHWRVVPDFRNLVIRAIPEEGARLAALRTGEADISVVSTDSSALLEKEGFRIREIKHAYGTMLMFGGLLNPTDARFAPTKDPWTDQRVRRALNLAIDRAAIARQLYQGRAVPHSTGWMFPGWEQEESYRYDVAEARRLLAEAGYPNGFSLEMPAYPLNPGTELPQLVEVVASYWDRIGVKAKIVPVDFSTYRRQWTAGKTQGKVSVMRMNFFPDWGTNAASYFGTTGPLPSYSDVEVDAAFQAAARETDLPARLRKFGELGRLLRKKDAMVGIAIVNDTTALRDTVGDWTPLSGAHAMYWEYITAKQPLRIFRLFEP